MLIYFTNAKSMYYIIYFYKKNPINYILGVFAFVDYKIDNDRSGSSLIQTLVKLGAQVEKTFNLRVINIFIICMFIKLLIILYLYKVTHVIFRDGYRKTYEKAIERKIPLVSARWIENCKIFKKMLNPADYPAVDLDKYTKPREINFNFPVSIL